MSTNIIVIGSSNVDFFMKMERLPRLGETVTDCEFMQVFGGKGANQAVGAARAGGKVTFVTCVGDDSFGEQMTNNFSQDGMNIEFVFREAGIASGSALIMIDSEGNNYLSVAPGANYRLKKPHIDKARQVIKDAELVLLQYEVLPETLEYILDTCYELKKKVVLNLAPARPVKEEYLKKVSILVVNEVEAEFLTGIHISSAAETEQAANILLSKGIETVVITLGKDGSYVASGVYREKIPAFRVDAVDTTAAGDVYCGSLCVALVEGKSLAEAVKFAGAASAISVTRLGAQPSAPTRDEIDAFLNSSAIFLISLP